MKPCKEVHIIQVEPHGQSPWFLINAPVGRHPPSNVGTGRPKDGVFIHSQRPWLSAAGVIPRSRNATACGGQGVAGLSRSREDITQSIQPRLD
jgi:hypothetical protein